MEWRHPGGSSRTGRVRRQRAARRLRAARRAGVAGRVWRRGYTAKVYALRYKQSEWRVCARTRHSLMAQPHGTAPAPQPGVSRVEAKEQPTCRDAAMRSEHNARYAVGNYGAAASRRRAGVKTSAGPVTTPSRLSFYFYRPLNQAITR